MSEPACSVRSLFLSCSPGALRNALLEFHTEAQRLLRVPQRREAGSRRPPLTLRASIDFFLKDPTANPTHRSGQPARNRPIVPKAAIEHHGCPLCGGLSERSCSRGALKEQARIQARRLTEHDGDGILRDAPIFSLTG